MEFSLLLLPMFFETTGGRLSFLHAFSFAFLEAFCEEEGYDFVTRRKL
jgi:hypothetical protein